MSATQTSNGRAQADCWGRLRQLRQAEQDALRAWRGALEYVVGEWAQSRVVVEQAATAGR